MFVLPKAVIVAGGVSYLIVVAGDVAVHPTAFVTLTLYDPEAVAV